MKSARRARLGFLALFVVAVPPTASAEDSGGRAKTTFYRDVLPILQENCQGCHRPLGANLGGVRAPMSLMTYEEVRPWAKSMARQAREKTMPPWFASPATDGLFTTERKLSDDEIEVLGRWANTGAALGRPEDAPPAKTFVEDETRGWSMGKPDLIVDLPEPFFVEDDVEDLNISLVTQLTDAQLPEDAWVKAIEFKGGSTMVHHICGYALAPDDRTDELEGLTRNRLGCIAPGAESRTLPEGHAIFLPRGARIAFSMHYHKEPGPGTGGWDRSQLAFIFAREPVRHYVRWEGIANGSFEIPPNHPRWRVGAAKTFDRDSTLLAIWPHMHLRGAAARYEAHYPDGSRELLLEVPNYDFDWQVMYPYRVPKKVPAGTRLEVTMWYDNSPERAARVGFDSNRSVRFGGPTTDEMMIGFLDYTETEAMDMEQIRAMAKRDFSRSGSQEVGK